MLFHRPKVFGQKRVLEHHLWEHISGEKIEGGAIDTRNAMLDGDKIIIDNGDFGKDTLILKSQYFSTMKIVNPKSKHVSTYRMKGGNWTEYIF